MKFANDYNWQCPHCLQLGCNEECIEREDKNMKNDLTKPDAITEMFKPKKWGVGAQREQAQKILAELDPKTMPQKLAIIFDDSGSMGEMNEKGDKTKIEDAKSGVRNFSTQCNPRDTALAIYPLNAESKPITCNFDLLNLLVASIGPTGGTPLYTKTSEMLQSPDSYTRGILFSDGEPTDESGYYASDSDEENIGRSSKDRMIDLAIAKKIPLDCVFIGADTDSGYKLMKEIADRTGGIFIHFKDSASLSANLKYLAPALRGILMNSELKAKIERGESI